jgi:hypothetical protein
MKQENVCTKSKIEFGVVTMEKGININAGVEKTT